jgi:hypothetical protein
MAEENLSQCCKQTLERKLRIIRAAYTSFPVIKDIACPICRKIIKIRVYEKGEEAQA